MSFDKDFDHPAYSRELASVAGKQSGALAIALGPITKENVHIRVAALLHEAVDILQSSPGVVLDSRLWGQLSCYAGDVLDTELTRRLHHERAHPDFEYDTTETSYKSSVEAYPPKGAGWKMNAYHYHGVTHDEPVDTYYWMRHKDDALRDDMEYKELSLPTVPPLKFYDYMLMLAATFNAGYFPCKVPFNANKEHLTAKDRFIDQLSALSTHRPEANSKPEYYTKGKFLDHLDPNRALLVVQNDGFFDSHDLTINETTHASFDNIYHYLETKSGKKEVAILTDLTDTFPDEGGLRTACWVRIKNKAGEWGEFQAFYDFIDLNVDSYDVKHTLEGW